MKVKRRSADTAVIELSHIVSDRDTGKPVMTSNTIVVFLPENALGIVKRVLALAQALWVHELEEAFRVGGVRIFDPHANGD